MTIESGEKIVNELLEQLNISKDDLISGAYMDAIEKNQH